MLMSRMNTAAKSVKARAIFIYQHFSFYEQILFRAHLS